MCKVKNSIYSLGYSFQEVSESIFLINNFFSESDLAPLWEIIDSATKDDWKKDYWDSQVGLAIKKFGRDDLENLLKEGLMEYTEHWSDKSIAVPENIVRKINERIEKIFSFDKNLYVGGISNIQRQYENSPLIEHVDSDGDPSVAFAVIGYMNDDYSDGELFFSRLGLKIKPPARSLIIFPSGENYIHGVKSPGPGPVRYALPTFVNYSDFFDNMP
jgi:hypothetical protein